MPPPVILAHRANLRGPEKRRENSLELCAEALRLGFGLETDLRRGSNGQFYIAHDPQPQTGENDFARFSELFRKHPECTVAMNVKELGYEGELIRLQASGALGNCSFYFDFELLEPGSAGRAQRQIVELPGGRETKIASRLSDRSEPLEQSLAIPAQVVWADEFDSLWLQAHHIAALKDSGRKVFVISPELHGFSDDDRLARWGNFREWQVDGVCTDYAIAARDFFHG